MDIVHSIFFCVLIFVFPEGMDIRRSFQTFLVVFFVVLTIEGKKHDTLVIITLTKTS